MEYTSGAGSPGTTLSNLTVEVGLATPPVILAPLQTGFLVAVVVSGAMSGGEGNRLAGQNTAMLIVGRTRLETGEGADDDAQEWCDGPSR